ncbi:MAG: hypothetical protein K2N09_08085, partial [Muribaculaceae bacterium]|nr:hypothetical protein [Muribaculaceae bacterium]
YDMKKSLIASLAALAFLCTGCAFSREATLNNNVTQTEVVLAKKNFRVVGHVSGKSEQNYWFGIGGMSKKSLGESAMSSMYRNADLKDSQAIINTNVCYKNKIIFIYNQTKAIATGTIIEFTE